MHTYHLLLLEEGHLGHLLLDAGAEHDDVAVAAVARLRADQRLDVHHVLLVCSTNHRYQLRERQRERERVKGVCVCVRERERKEKVRERKKGESVCERERDRKRKVCVYEREREKEREKTGRVCS